MPENNDIGKQILEWASAQAKEVQTTLYERIRDDTPVDTGFAQASWVNDPLIQKIGDTGIIKNDCPYIGYLEYGHSDQAPVGMVRVNIQKIIAEGSAQ